MINIQDSLTFDDVLMVPQYSEITSRSQVDISVDLGKGFRFELPFMPANMSNVTDFDMAWKFYTLKGLALLHRFDTFENRAQVVKDLISKCRSEDILNYIGVSCGVKDIDKDELRYFIEDLKVKIVGIDIAHLDSKLGMDMVKYVSSTYPKVLLMAGTIATGGAAERAWQNGCDCVRINLGNGSICTTSLSSGVGVGQISALSSVYEMKKELQPKYDRKLTMIADGGMNTPGSFCKALALADMCLSGNFFSATDEAPGAILEIDGVKYKEYNGSSTHKKDRIEGVRALKRYKGPIDPIINKLIEGIQSSCSYNNAHNLDELKANAKFIRVTHNRVIESGSHNLDKIL